MSECSRPSALEAVKAARDLLENVTPLPTDCGAFCSAACCKDDPDYETSGMLLFPGEEALYDNPAAKMWMALSPSGLAHEGKPVPLLSCKLPCPRRMRPLACRLFPLTPYVKGDKLTVRIDVRARPVCPLCDSGLAGLSPEFVSAVKQALRILWAQPEQRVYLRTLTEHLKEYEWL